MSAERTSWTFVIPSGRVTASLDVASQTEQVWLAGELLSRSSIGERPNGHRIDLRALGDAYRNADTELVVTFDLARGCTATVDGRPIAEESRLSSSRARPRRLWSVGAPALVAAAVVAFLVAPRLARPPRAGLPLTELAESADGTIALHYPDGFEAVVADNEDRVRVTVVDRDGSMMVGAIVTPEREPDRDSLRSVGLVETRAAPLPVPPSAARRLCRGDAGATDARALHLHGRPASVWSCTFTRDGRSFSIFRAVTDARIDDDGVLADRILDALVLQPRASQ